MYYGYDQEQFEDLVGKTLVNIVGGIEDTEMSFITDDGDTYVLYHEQDCCEGVDIDDIIGDIDNMIGSPILSAEEVTFDRENPKGLTKEWQDDSFTWTFYKLSTEKGYLTIRWYGESNGYYSESVEFRKLSNKIC